MRKSLVDRIKKVQCDRIVNRHELANFHSDIQIDWIKMEMYNRLIQELRKNGFIEETVEDTPTGSRARRIRRGIIEYMFNLKCANMKKNLIHRKMKF